MAGALVRLALAHMLQMTVQRRCAARARSARAAFQPAMTSIGPSRPAFAHLNDGLAALTTASTVAGDAMATRRAQRSTKCRVVVTTVATRSTRGLLPALILLLLLLLTRQRTVCMYTHSMAFLAGQAYGVAGGEGARQKSAARGAQKRTAPSSSLAPASRRPEESARLLQEGRGARATQQYAWRSSTDAPTIKRVCRGRVMK